MASSAEQIHEAAQLWYTRAFAFQAGNGVHHQGASAGDGPYHLLIAVNPAEASFMARMALAYFAGVPIPRVSKFSGEIRAGLMSLHVVPQMVYSVLAANTGFRFLLNTDLEPPPFAHPPTEADMAEVFMAAMSDLGDLDQDQQQTAAVIRAACEQMGWRNVADLVNTMNAAATRSIADVVAILEALLAGPAG